MVFFLKEMFNGTLIALRGSNGFIGKGKNGKKKTNGRPRARRAIQRSGIIESSGTPIYFFVGLWGSTYVQVSTIFTVRPRPTTRSK